jgi:hypothetical protein
VFCLVKENPTILTKGVLILAPCNAKVAKTITDFDIATGFFGHVNSAIST